MNGVSCLRPKLAPSDVACFPLGCEQHRTNTMERLQRTPNGCVGSMWPATGDLDHRQPFWKSVEKLLQDVPLECLSLRWEGVQGKTKPVVHS